jgi:hypothetical protein
MSAAATIEQRFALDAMTSCIDKTLNSKPMFSYTIPLLKGNAASLSKSSTASDYRGISIGPVLSKVFENCICKRCKHLFITLDNQFGFKKLYIWLL